MVDMRSERSLAPRTHTKISSVLCCVPSSPRARFQRRQQPISFASSRGSRSRAGRRREARRRHRRPRHARQAAGLPSWTRSSRYSSHPSPRTILREQSRARMMTSMTSSVALTWNASASVLRRHKPIAGGKVNGPASIRRVAECLARSKGCDSTSRPCTHRQARGSAASAARTAARLRRAPSTRRLAKITWPRASVRAQPAVVMAFVAPMTLASASAQDRARHASVESRCCQTING